MARRTRIDAPIKTAEITAVIELPVKERLDFYIAKGLKFGTPISLDRLVQVSIDEFLRKYGMC